MRSLLTIAIIAIMVSAVSWVGCNQNKAEGDPNTSKDSVTTFGSDRYTDKAQFGKHLVAIGGCNDCHTPKKMTAMGPVPDTSLTLSGHPSAMPYPDVNRKDIESKGLGVTNDLTSWVGPWGISYAANLTPDSTGIGRWTEAQFTKAIREGKWMGLDGTRQLLPPMPWQEFREMNDNEISAIFAYLKSLKPVHNVVPDAAPPVAAASHP